MVDRAQLADGLATTLEEASFPELGSLYRGKVRDNYTHDGRRTIVVSDRISAFDRVLGTLPFKGQVLNTCAAWWFDKTRDVAPNHVLDVPDPAVTVAIDCEPLPVEMVMRSYLTGVTSTSIWSHYQRGVRTFCGHALPDGLRQHEKLPAPILTPSTKAEHGAHDVSVSREDILASGKVSARDFDEAAEHAKALFAFGQAHCERQGLILVDTKYEFGKTRDGRVIVIDEIHTPDSSRYWLADSYEERFKAGETPASLDKEYVRRWLAEQGYTGEGTPPVLTDEVRIEASARYIEACERVSGNAFFPDLEPPIARIRKNLLAKES